MVDPISATALIVAVISAIGSLITQIHINKCKSSCCESDCTKTPKNTPPNSPVHRLSTIEKKNSELYHNLEELVKNSSHKNNPDLTSSNV
jgi:cell division protein FtsN